MKKLGKLNLMKENMLSYEELVSFKGGSGGEPDCDGNPLWGGCQHYYCTCQDGYEWDAEMCCATELMVQSYAICTYGMAQCTFN